MPLDPDTAIGGAARGFPSTSGTMIAELRSDSAETRTRAAGRLAAVYWKPLYKYLRFRSKITNEDAKDLVQSFFATAAAKDLFGTFDPSRASFRTWVRLLFDHHVANELKSAQRQKRGGGMLVDFESVEEELLRHSPAQSVSPEELLQQEWVRSVFEEALRRVRRWAEAEQKERALRLFEEYDLSGDPGLSYSDLAQRHGIPLTTVTNHLAAMRRKFRESALDVVRECTASEAEFRAEAKALFGRVG